MSYSHFELCWANQIIRIQQFIRRRVAHLFLSWYQMLHDFVRHLFYKCAYQLIGIHGDLFTARFICCYRESLHRRGELFELVNTTQHYLHFLNGLCLSVLQNVFNIGKYLRKLQSLVLCGINEYSKPVF